MTIKRFLVCSLYKLVHATELPSYPPFGGNYFLSLLPIVLFTYFHPLSTTTPNNDSYSLPPLCREVRTRHWERWKSTTTRKQPRKRQPKTNTIDKRINWTEWQKITEIRKGIPQKQDRRINSKARQRHWTRNKTDKNHKHLRRTDRLRHEYQSF